jgi:hypothetical protein
VLLRQRIFTVTESSSQISAIAKPLLTPLVAPLLRFLLNHKQVGYVISTNYWGEKEDSFLFYHHGFEKTVGNEELKKTTLFFLLSSVLHEIKNMFC